MTLKPVAAKWFELLTDRQNLAEVMRLLAASKAVELEVSGTPNHALLFPDLADQLEDTRRLAKRYADYWPDPRLPEQCSMEMPLERCEKAITRLHAWQAKADPVIDLLEQEQHDYHNLTLLKTGLSMGKDSLPDLSALAKAGPLIEARLFHAAESLALERIPPLVLHQHFTSPENSYLLIVGTARDLKPVSDHLRGKGARLVSLPDWLPLSPSKAIAQIAVRLETLAVRIDKHQQTLVALNMQLRIAEALGTIELIEWLGEHADELQGTEDLAWITGWTSEPDGRQIKASFDKAGVKYLFNIASPPLGTTPPLFLFNPRWGQRFEIFTKLLGIPGENNVDPSILVALIAPLLFGFMFGDVGQGAVILIAGLILGRRIAALKFLVPCGLMAILFGVMFGSIFGLEDVIPALWFHPMQEPIRALTYGIAIGIAILLTGLLLNALQAHWRRQAADWWGRDIGMLACYVGLLLAIFDQRFLMVSGLGASYFILGGLLRTRSRPAEQTSMVFMQFGETLFQLVVNTVSFARVGAFALAHAGLSTAVIGIAEAAGGLGYWIVLVLGNLLVIALEGLVVAIQTTRLILFEFFVRFFQANGRPFKTLSPPIRNHSILSETRR